MIAESKSRECIMPTSRAAQLLRIFIGENDKHHGRPLYEAIVEAARERGLAGATVLRGTLGFGAHSLIHSAKILQLSEDLPMVVEIIDAPDRIAELLTHLEPMLDDGLVTLETVEVVVFRAPQSG
jgi:uncharacterized protein